MIALAIVAPVLLFSVLMVLDPADTEMSLRSRLGLVAIFVVVWVPYQWIRLDP